ncbi:MAG: ATP-binding cassette domain-containing protein [Alphaproteobacteria bacterium]|nr:ATP-binding cassette domain-containing protein [Alphaproteobacteria bacterium]
MTAARPAAGAPLLEVRDLAMHFPVRRGLLQRTVGHVRAVDGISFALAEGETLGLVGESGCGKSTVGGLILRLLEPTAGSVLVRGRDIAHLGRGELKPFRREVQMVFQDPYASLDPRQSAGAMVAEPFAIHSLAARGEIRDQVARLFDRVGLRREHMQRYPHEFSGGQRQRLSIARALALNPRLIVADEPVSALDVSIQAQVINLMTTLQRELGLAYLFISHDIAVIGHISQRIAVMYLGKLVEIAPRATLLAGPLHPYTEMLLNAVPIPNPRLKRKHQRAVASEVPSPLNPPTGCRFHTRCPLAEARCRSAEPVLREVRPRHHVACHLR